MLVSCGCCNKLPQAWGFTATETYSLTVPGARRQKSRPGEAGPCSLLRLLGRSLLASSGLRRLPWHSCAVAASPRPAPSFTGPCCLCSSGSKLPWTLSYRAFRACLDDSGYAPSLRVPPLITSFAIPADARGLQGLDTGISVGAMISLP